MLTFSGEWNEYGGLMFRIPNLVVRSLYGERLRLRTFTVVAVGFDRLVWEELG